MLTWALITFCVAFAIGLVFAHCVPSSKAWILAEYFWVTVATLSIFAAIQDARKESQSFEREDRTRNIELSRYIASHFAEGQIISYSQRLKSEGVSDLERQTWQDGIRWFESASRALVEVHDSKSWQEYLPTGSQFDGSIIPEPDISRADWLAQDQQRLASFVAKIEDSFNKLGELQPDIPSENFASLFVLLTPFLIALAGALELAAVRAKNIAERNATHSIRR